MFEEFFVGSREVFVLVFDGFLFAHGSEELVVCLGFLYPKYVMKNKREVEK